MSDSTFAASAPHVRQQRFVVAAVAVGGAAGASGRWLVGEGISSSAGQFPWATLIVNIVGCVAIGLAARRLERTSLWWPALVTGVLGGFTTMSTFANEINELFEAGRSAVGLAYAVATVAAGWTGASLAAGPVDADVAA